MYGNELDWFDNWLQISYVSGMFRPKGSSWFPVALLLLSILKQTVVYIPSAVNNLSFSTIKMPLSWCICPRPCILLVNSAYLLHEATCEVKITRLVHEYGVVLLCFASVWKYSKTSENQAIRYCTLFHWRHFRLWTGWVSVPVICIMSYLHVHHVLWY